MKYINFVLVCIFITFSSCTQNRVEKNTVVLLSIDGFAHDYLSKYMPENILKMANEGVQTKGLKPVFPSKTFPNHLSIVTGVYPAKHGIIHNQFYHSIIKQKYQMGKGKYDERWLTALPIWTIAEQQDVKTAIYFWPESEAEIAGYRPTHFYEYNESTPNNVRINQIINWLKLPQKKRPQFIASYFSTVDTAGHKYGVDSPQVKQAIKDIDTLIGELNQRIAQEIDHDVDVILVSDHGMAKIEQTHAIDIDSLITQNNKIRIVNGETQFFIYSNDEKSLNDTRTQLLKSASVSANNKTQTRLKVYSKGNYPEHWHYDTNSVVIPDMVVDAIAPYNFYKDKVYSNEHKEGTHGYDSKFNKELNAIFIAKGPSFKQGVVVDEFENIDIFPLLMHLLKLDKPSVDYEVDGKIDSLIPALNETTNLERIGLESNDLKSNVLELEKQAKK